MLTAGASVAQDAALEPTRVRIPRPLKDGSHEEER
jgi:hypothetical protein